MSDPVETIPAFAVCPMLRCYHTEGFHPLVVCGEFARWRTPGRHWYDDLFFCDRHRSDNDELIVDVVAFRRVRITGDVFLAGTNIRPPQAQAEAVGRLEALVAAAGGILDIHGVLSTVGRTKPRLAPGDTNGRDPRRG